MSKPTANWDRVGDRFYRRVQLYTSVFDQDLELENYTIAGAPYSGAVGTLTRPHIESGPSSPHIASLPPR